jgi:hypothetical protein
MQHTLGWRRLCDRFPAVRLALHERGWTFSALGKLERME